MAVRILKLRCNGLKPLLIKAIQRMVGHLSARIFVLRANSLETVAGWTLNSRATSAAPSFVSRPVVESRASGGVLRYALLDGQHLVQPSSFLEAWRARTRRMLRPSALTLGLPI